ncbi:MAG TPA: helical backbone metal receptor, partial [Candidatus Ozemobacteraceae bacterium]
MAASSSFSRVFPSRERAGRSRSIVLALLLPVFLWLAYAASATGGRDIPASATGAVMPGSAVPHRIVSLVPSLTETLFALGLGSRIVGITDFCDHLPEARSIPSIGTCLEPSVEAIAARGPDLVLYGPDQEPVARRLRGLGLNCVPVRQLALGDIPEAVLRLGDICGAPAAAASAAARFKDRLDAVARAVGDRPRPRVLLCVGRDVAGGRIEQAYVAAPGAYHDALLRVAGAENAWRGRSLTSYPVVTQEGLMGLDPEIIVDLVPDPDRQPGGL